MVIVIMGVSGAGKTTIGRAVAERLGWRFEDADAWHSAASIEKMRRGVALTDTDRRPWIRSLNRALRGWIESTGNVVLACSALRRSYRQELRAGVTDSAAIRFVYLQASYEAIDRRLRERPGHFMPPSLLTTQFATLEEPDVSEAIRVAADLPVADVVRAIIAALGLRQQG